MTRSDTLLTPSALIDLITALWLGFIGACIGSFLNVVAYRMPLGMSVIWKPSHCPKCNHPIRAYDNVPVLGWLWLKGKCRDCSEPISPRYAIVELVMGLAFLVLAYVELFSGGANLPGGPITEFTGAANIVWVPQWKLIGVYAYHGLLLSLLASIVLISLDSQRVPLSLVIFGVATGFLAPLVWSHLNPPAPSTNILEHPIVSIKLLCLFVGCLIGTFFWGSEFWGDPHQWEIHWKNSSCMFVLAWSFLGWRGLLVSYLLAVVLGGIWRFARQWFKEIPAPIGEMNFVVSSFLLIVFWSPLSAMLP